MTSTRPKRNVRNTTPAPPVEDDKTIIHSILDRLVFTVDVMARFDQTRRDIAAFHRGEIDRPMSALITEARWHEGASKARKDCPLGSTEKHRRYEEDSDDSDEDDPNVPSTSSKPVKPRPPPTPSKAKLAAMKRKADAERRKAQREAKKLEALEMREEVNKVAETTVAELAPEKIVKEEITKLETDIPQQVPDQDIQSNSLVEQEEKMEVDVSPDLQVPTLPAPTLLAPTFEVPAQETTPQELPVSEPTEDPVSNENSVVQPDFAPQESTKQTEEPLEQQQIVQETTTAAIPDDSQTPSIAAEPPIDDAVFKVPLVPESTIDVPSTSEPSATKQEEQEIEVRPADPIPPSYPVVQESNEIEYSPGEVSRKPWLDKKYNTRLLYPLDYLPPFNDGVPGRVWWPPLGRYAAIFSEGWNGFGPLTELQTLDFSLREQYMDRISGEHSCLIQARFIELLLPHYHKELADPNKTSADQAELRKRIKICEIRKKSLSEENEKRGYRVLCLPEIAPSDIPKKTQFIKYTKFDPTWYSSSRKWATKSAQILNRVTQKDFIDRFQETTDSIILEFQREMLAKAKQVEDEYEAERIKNFYMPLLYDLTKQKPHVGTQMSAFRERLARLVQYEDFERMYMNDPSCREIWKIAEPIPSDMGKVTDEADEELCALISFYKKRFGEENPIMQLPKAGNEKKPNAKDISRIATRCLTDVIDTVVLREQSDCPTFPHRIPVHNNAIQ